MLDKSTIRNLVAARDQLARELEACNQALVALGVAGTREVKAKRSALSAEGRRNIVIAQKKRWAAHRAAQAKKGKST